jgi:hypothetical protein
MRFRKTRSLLSAFSNDELSDRKQELVRDKLAGSELLRREEAVFRSIRKAAGELPELRVSDDFNARLLNRIARERFAETRTKAYLPRRSVPRIWRQVVPALAAVALAIFVTINVFVSPDTAPERDVAADDLTADLYLTVQPDNNPYMVGGFGRNVSLQQLVAKIDRADELSSFLTSSGIFATNALSRGSDWLVSDAGDRMPYTRHYYKVLPVFRVSGPSTTRQEERVY